MGDIAHIRDEQEHARVDPLAQRSFLSSMTSSADQASRRAPWYGGTSFGARSVAEAVGAPFFAVVYTPNVLGEDRPRLPRALDQIVQRWRALRGLAPMQTDLMRHAHPPERALPAADLELSGAPLTGLQRPATGALLLDGWPRQVTRSTS